MKYLAVAEAIERATGSRPHPTTCWRWTKKGCGGTKLQTWVVGGRRVTTIDAVQLFVSARTEATAEIAEPATAITDKLRKELYSTAG